MLNRYFFERLRLEREIVNRHLPQFRSYSYATNPYFSGAYTTTAGGRRYTLKLVIPSGYPDDRPSLYVTNPLTLRKFGYRGTVNKIGASHDFHTWSNGPNGCVQICHTKSDQWDASQTCVGVLMKGLLWTEAYDAYMATGRTIAKILKEWQRRQPW